MPCIHNLRQTPPSPRAPIAAPKTPAAIVGQASCLSTAKLQSPALALIATTKAFASFVGQASCLSKTKPQSLPPGMLIAARLLILLFAPGLFLFASSGCRKEPSPAPEKKIASTQKKYSRIVSLAPGITEIIFFLGEQDRLVGVTSHCDFPPAAKKIADAGGFGEPSVERILSLHPDLVLTSDYKAHPAFSKMQSLNLNVVDLETKSFEDAIELVRTVGEIIGTPEKGRAKAAELEARIERIRSRHLDEKKPPRVYVELWYSPITTTGKGSFVSDMISALGAENVFGGIGKPYPQINSEAVVQRNPDIIIIGYMLEKQNKDAYIKNRPAWSGINAVRNGRVYSDIPPDLFLRAGPRLVDGLEQFEKKIYGNK